MNINNIIRMMAVALLMTGAMACKAQKDGGGSIDADAQSVALPSFDAIHNDCAVRLHIAQGNRQSVWVKHAPDWRIEVSVSDRTLKLKEEQSFGQLNKCAEVWITVPALKSIGNNGALYVDGNNIKGKELSVTNNGALTLSGDNLNIGILNYNNKGSITENLRADCKEVHIDNVGSFKTQLTLAGNDIFTLNNRGSYGGDIEIAGKTINIENGGAMNGDMAIHAATLTFNNNGSGTQKISFFGDEMNIDNNGSVNVDLQVDCKKLHAESSGVSTLVISGTADDTRIKSGGISNIDSSKLNRF